MTCPQFGDPLPGRAYADRPCAFGIAERDGRILVVQVLKPDEPPYFDLPGGALDPGEDEASAMVREYGEETGHRAAPAGLICRAAQYVERSAGAANNLCAFFAAELGPFEPGLKSEERHETVFMAPEEAIGGLRHEAHAWAVACWLRSRA